MQCDESLIGVLVVISGTLLWHLTSISKSITERDRNEIEWQRLDTSSNEDQWEEYNGEPCDWCFCFSLYFWSHHVPFLTIVDLTTSNITKPSATNKQNLRFLKKKRMYVFSWNRVSDSLRLPNEIWLVYLVANMSILNLHIFSAFWFFGFFLLLVFCSIRSQCEGRSPVARQILPPEVNDSIILHYGPGPQGTQTHTSRWQFSHAKTLSYVLPSCLLGSTDW